MAEAVVAMRAAAPSANSAMIKAWTSLVVNTFVSTDVGVRDKSQVKTPTRQEPLAHLGGALVVRSDELPRRHHAQDIL